MSYFRPCCLAIFNLRPYVNESHDHCFIHTYIEREWVWICDWVNWQVNELICEWGSESLWVKVSGVSWWLIWLPDVCMCGCACLVTSWINQSIDRSIYWLSDWVVNWMWVFECACWCGVYEWVGDWVGDSEWGCRDGRTGRLVSVKGWVVAWAGDVVFAWGHWGKDWISKGSTDYISRWMGVFVSQWSNEWEGLQWELMIIWMGGWVDCTVQREWMSALQKDLWMSRWLRIWLIEGVAVLIGDVRGCWFVIFVRVSEWMSMCVSMSVWLI